MVTSPPYNVGKEYDEILLWTNTGLFEKGWQRLRVLVLVEEFYKNCEPRKKPIHSLHTFIVRYAEPGVLMLGEIIWNKASSGSPSTAWVVGFPQKIRARTSRNIPVFFKDFSEKIVEEKHNF